MKGFVKINKDDLDFVSGGIKMPDNINDVVCKYGVPPVGPGGTEPIPGPIPVPGPVPKYGVMPEPDEIDELLK